MSDEKQSNSTTGKIMLGVGIAVLVTVVFIIGRRIGYNRGFDKGVGWE